MANLNNRQQAAVLNAKAFLDTDMKNLDNAQQMAVMKTQTISQAILSDTSAENAAKATNAANALEADKISATLTLTANQFNASEKNKISLADANAANELGKFNAQQQNQRAEFNANMTSQINVANAKILADISVANTAAENTANAVNAKNATDMDASVYAQQSTTYRDLLEMSYKSGEYAQDRIMEIAKASIAASTTLTSANIKADSDSWGALGDLAGKFATSTSGQNIIDAGLKKLFGG
jgi:hypothetical protein